MDTLNIISSTFFLQISLSLSESNQEETSLQSERFQPNWNTQHTHSAFWCCFKYSPRSSPTRISSCLPTNASLIASMRSRLTRLLILLIPLHSTWLEADPGGKITLFNAYFIDLLRNSFNLDGIEINSGNIHCPNPRLLENMLAAGLRLHRGLDSTSIWGTHNTPTPLLEGLYATYCQVTERILGHRFLTHL